VNGRVADTIWCNFTVNWYTGIFSFAPSKFGLPEFVNCVADDRAVLEETLPVYSIVYIVLTPRL